LLGIFGCYLIQAQTAVLYARYSKTAPFPYDLAASLHDILN
jgi:hypothetical protein